MPRRKQNRPMRVGEEAGGEMEPGSAPDTDVKEHEDEEEEKKGQSPTRSDSSPPHAPICAASGSSTFAPLDLSIKKSSTSSPPSSRGGRSPSPLSLRIPATRSPSLPHHLPMNGSSTGVVTMNHQPMKNQPMNHEPVNHEPVNSLGPIIPTSVSSTPKTSGKSISSKSGLSSRGSGNRQNPWQTQWMNRSSEQTRDVFTCVWCKESFKSLQDMTLHMKKSPRCGMAGMQQAAAATASGSLSSALSSSALSSSALSSSAASQSAVTSHHQHHSTSVPSSPLLSHHPHAHLPVHHLSSSSSSGVAGNGSAMGGKGGRSGGSSGATSGKSSEPMSSAVLAKNNVALPRKLVRGQDVWLGRGAEQTRQILKCMWCAQSFKSLDEMTRHMRITQHYTNIISQEQIISWRTPEDKVTQAQVNAVLTCKVCDEAFGSLKELSYHMVKNAHYKEHILRSITEGGHGRRRQTRERRKKSLPVRKLLELERMEIVPPGSSDPSNVGQKISTPSASSSTKSTSEKVLSRDSDTPTNNNNNNNNSMNKDHHQQRGSSTSTPSLSSSSSITCDECNEQVESRHFISHLKECIKQQLTSQAGGSVSTVDGSRSSPKSIPRSPDSVRSNVSGRPESSTGGERRGPSRCNTESPSSITDAVTKDHQLGERHPLLKKEPGDGSSGESDLESDEEKSVGKRRKSPSPKGRLEEASSVSSSVSAAPATQSSSSACLSALENLIEKSFDTKSLTPTHRTSSHRLDKSHNHHRSHHHGSSGHHHHSKSSKSHLLSTSSATALSNVEKWMTLAKERDGAPSTFSSQGNNVWSPSMSSSSNSSWNHPSDDEGGGKGNLVMNLKRSNHDRDLRSPSSSASADSRPGSSAIARTSKRSQSPVGVKVSSSDIMRKRMKIEEEEKLKRSTPISKIDSEEERREEIEELKRSGGLKSPESPMNSSAGKNSTSSESLSALERLIEKSFDSKKKNTPTGFLQRLGIDEEVCPPWQPGLLAAAAGLPFGQLPFQPWLIPKLTIPNQDSRSSSSSSPAKTTKNGSICSSPPAT